MNIQILMFWGIILFFIIFIVAKVYEWYLAQKKKIEELKTDQNKAVRRSKNNVKHEERLG